MAKEWYLMTRPLYNSGYEKDEFEAYAVDGFEEMLDSFLSTEIDLYKTNDFSLSEKIKVVVDNVTSDSEYGTYMRQIISKMNTIKSGYYVGYNNNLWLIRDLVDNNKMYEKALMFYCNYKINFISSVTNEIVTYPVYMKNATQYNSGEIAHEHETIGSTKYLVFIKCDEHTLPLNNGKRFLIDKNKEEPTAFELTQADTVSYNYDKTFGVIRWTIVESQYNILTDNKELMIADYYKTENNQNSSGNNPNPNSNFENDSESTTGGWL